MVYSTCTKILLCLATEASTRLFKVSVNLALSARLIITIIVLLLGISAVMYGHTTLHKKATMYQLTTMLAISKNVLFPGHNHLLTTGADDPSLAGDWAIIKVPGYQHRWLAGTYDLEIGHFQRWIAWWLPGG